MVVKYGEYSFDKWTWEQQIGIVYYWECWIDSWEFIVSPNVKCIVFGVVSQTEMYPSRKIIISVFTVKVPRQTNIIETKRNETKRNQVTIWCTRKINRRLAMQESVERTHHYHFAITFGCGRGRLLLLSFVCLFACFCLCLCYHFCGCVASDAVLGNLCATFFIIGWESFASKMWCHCWRSWCESHHEKRIKWCQCCLIVCVRVWCSS